MATPKDDTVVGAAMERDGIGEALRHGGRALSAGTLCKSTCPYPSSSCASSGLLAGPVLSGLGNRVFCGGPIRPEFSTNTTS